MNMRKSRQQNNYGNTNRDRGRRPPGRRAQGGGGGGNDRQQYQRAMQNREKYMSKAKDALSGGERIEAEYWFQHADHYNRIILQHQEAHAERQARREQEQEEASDSDDRQQDSASDSFGAPEDESKKSRQRRAPRKPREPRQPEGTSTMDEDEAEDDFKKRFAASTIEAPVDEDDNSKKAASSQ